MKWETRVKLGIEKIAEECRVSVDELGRRMKEFSGQSDFNLYKWVESQLFKEEYHNNLRKMQRDRSELNYDSCNDIFLIEDDSGLGFVL